MLTYSFLRITFVLEDTNYSFEDQRTAESVTYLSGFGASS